jgi:hypothetical protein
MTKEQHYCSVQLIGDWNGSSIIEIDGVHFAFTGFGGHCSFDKKDLDDGLQDRIWRAVLLVAAALNGDVVDCRPNVKGVAQSGGEKTSTKESNS